MTFTPSLYASPLSLGAACAHAVDTRKVSRNPEDLITFTHKVAALGGKILDAKRKPITEESLAAMYREGE